MPSVTVDRVAAAAGSDTAERASDVVRTIFDLLPWSAQLPADDFAEMLDDLHRAAVSRLETADSTELERLIDEWQATAEAYGNRGLMAHLGRTDRVYVPWE